MNDIKQCAGCGIVLQNENILFEGYTSSLDNNLCSRCFKLRNYGEYQLSTKSNEEYIEILKSVGNTKDLVLYVVDLLNIDKDLKAIRNFITNRVILVITKRDILPKSIKDEKIIEYVSKLGLDYQDIMIISSNKNYNLDELMLMIKREKSSKYVYVVGHTNVGKSSIINKFIKNYSVLDTELTISFLPSTTLNKMDIEINDDLTLIDTPGLVDRGNIIHYVDVKAMKKIIPRQEIKPKTYQLKNDQTVIIDDLVRIDYLEGEKNSFTFYVSNDLKMRKLFLNRGDKLKNLSKREIEVYYNQDIVINGLGFIKIKNKCKVDIYIDKSVDVYTRNSLI